MTRCLALLVVSSSLLACGSSGRVPATAAATATTATTAKAAAEQQIVSVVASSAPAIKDAGAIVGLCLTLDPGPCDDTAISTITTLRHETQLLGESLGAVDDATVPDELRSLYATTVEDTRAVDDAIDEFDHGRCAGVANGRVDPDPACHTINFRMQIAVRRLLATLDDWAPYG